MQRSDIQTAKTAHRRVRTSTTLNRKYVKQPARSADVSVSIKRSPRISHFNTTTTAQVASSAAQPVREQVVAHPLQVAANDRLRIRRAASTNSLQAQRPTAKELKDQAIRKALAAAEKTEQPTEVQSKKTKKKMHFGFGRVMLALGCTAVAVFAIVYFVNLNMPDVSLKVAAMQVGINASYPSYVPRDYNVSSINSGNGEITMSFSNSKTGGAFDLIEKKSYWDSNALLSNYVKEKYEENYTVVREQGITIYISNSDAAWVNGGIVYKIINKSGSLTNKQIKSIVVSL